jgi:outer membrane protein, heavy metal efflux system
MPSFAAPPLRGAARPSHRSHGALWSLIVASALSACAQVTRQNGLAEVQELVSRRGVDETLEWRDAAEAPATRAAAIAELLDGELTADAAVRIALLNNPRVQATYEELGIADAEVVQASLPRNPGLTAAALFGGVSPTYDFDVAVSFLDAILIPARTRIAEAQFDRTRVAVAGEVFDLAQEVRRAFYTLQGAEQLVDVLALVLASTEASNEFAESLHGAGNLSDLQLATERALVEEVRARVLRARAETVEPREQLRELLGLSAAGSSFEVGRRLPGVPLGDPTLESVLARAQESRLDLAEAERDRAVLAETLETARSWRYFGAVEVGAETHREQGESNWVSGPSLSLELPLFDQKQAELARLEAQLRQTERRAESAAIAVAAEVRRAYGALEAARSLAAHYREAVLPVRQRVVALSEEFYNFMLLGTFELLGAKREEIAAYTEYIEAVRDYWIARAELEKAVGARIPVPGPVEPTSIEVAHPPAHRHGEH